MPEPEPAESVPPLARDPNAVRFVLALALVSVAAAGFAVLFRLLLSYVFRYAYGAANVVLAFQALPWWARLAVPTLGGVLAGLTAVLVARGGRSQGVGDVMEAVIFGRVQLSMRVTLLKSLGSWFAIATGGSIGREGPIIQFGGSIGSLIAKLAGLDMARARTLIAAGTAAGFAAAYNTPLAAILFVLEVVTGIVALDVVVPTIAATALATALTRAVVGGGPIYGQRAFGIASEAEVIAYAGLGLLAALAAQCFMRLLSAGEAAFAKTRVAQPWRAGLGGLFVGVIALRLPEVTGNGYEPLNAVLDGRFAHGMLALLFLAKAVATTASVSSGSPGGVFTPTLLLGAALGSCYGNGLAHVFGVGAVASHGAYALVGMAAMIAATTHAPIMAAVLVFELSGDYAIALPLLLATSIATFVSHALRSDSIYTAELRERGVAWELTLEGRRRSPRH